MGKFLNRKDDIDPGHDPFANSLQDDPGMGGQPPLDEGFHDDGGFPQDPLGAPQAPPQQSFAPSRFDTTNPDMNSQLGIPKPRDPYEREQQQPQQQFQPAQQSNTGIEKDLQIILAKLDAIKSELDSLHQRVQKIERIAEADQAQAKQPSRYQW